MTIKKTDLIKSYNNHVRDIKVNFKTLKAIDIQKYLDDLHIPYSKHDVIPKTKKEEEEEQTIEGDIDPNNILSLLKASSKKDLCNAMNKCNIDDISITKTELV